MRLTQRGGTLRTVLSSFPPSTSISLSSPFYTHAASHGERAGIETAEAGIGIVRDVVHAVNSVPLYYNMCFDELQGYGLRRDLAHVERCRGGRI